MTPAGSVLDPSGILISRNTAVNSYYPAVAWGGTRYLVAWGNYGTPYAVYGRLVNTNGTFASDTIRLATGAAGIYHTHLAYDGTNFMVIWVEMTSPYTLKGIRVSNSGMPLGSPFTIASNVFYFKSARICFDGINYFVTYTRTDFSPYQLWGRKYDTNGSPVGSALRITPTTYGTYYGDVVPGANNRYLNVWNEYRSSDDIYANLDVMMVGIEEQSGETRTVAGLKSMFISDCIELTGQQAEAEIFDAAGRYLGRTEGGVYDCSALRNGIYFVKTTSGATLKAVKIR